MYKREIWLDDVRENKFLMTNLEDQSQTKCSLRKIGEVQQQGTPQDQIRFNNMEAGISETYFAAAMLMIYARQQAQDIERGRIKLTNNSSYPFNSSKITVPLGVTRDTEYTVLTEVISHDGLVGDISVSDKLSNGFKLAYDGSAKNAVIKYIVIGGHLK